MWNIAIFYIVVLVHALCQPVIQSYLYLKFISQNNFIHPFLHLSLISGKKCFYEFLFVLVFFISLLQYKFAMQCRSHTCGWYAVHTLAVDMPFTHLRFICRSHTCSWYVIHTLAVDMPFTLVVHMSFTHLQLMICRSHTCGWYAVHTHLRLICCPHTCGWYVILARAAPMNDIQQLHVIHSAPSVLPQKSAGST